MSGSPEDCQADQANASSSSSSNGAAQKSAALAAREDKSAVPIEKTISCVSCRKRKLKCDRTKPKCGTCMRLRHECEYPERRRNLGSKRRNMKELEARLAQVETQLVSETAKSKSQSPNQPPLAKNPEPDWNSFPMDMDMNVDFVDDFLDPFAVPDTSYSIPHSIPAGDFFSQEVISLGLQEALPPDDMTSELHHLYFEKFHTTMPMMHKQRYLTALNLPAHMRPPVCLRYAIWATAASVSDNYSQYEELLYERARKYVDAAEMKGHGETFVTIQHAQTWGLIATYEAKKTLFTRAWMSTGRMARLIQMLGLHRLDIAQSEVKQILPPARDCIEQEERRRTFWAAFYGDRWASSGTGWPMIIQESEIKTNLPCSEDAFERGVFEQGISLQDALTPEGASKISPFGGVVLSACLFGHNFIHLHHGGPDDRPEDLSNGEFWKRHRKMDNVLSNTFMFLPDHLRLPGGLRDMNIVFLHMNIHASTICLHQAAVIKADQNGLEPGVIRQSRARSLMAAEEIASIMRLVSHLDASNMNSWMGFCLYVAAGVFIQDLRGDRPSPTSLTNLDFLLSAMKAIGNRHSITIHFTTQVELDMENSGIRKSVTSRFQEQQTPNSVLARPMAETNRQPMNVRDLYSYVPTTDFSGHDPLGTPHPGVLLPEKSSSYGDNLFSGILFHKDHSSSPILAECAAKMPGIFPPERSMTSPQSNPNEPLISNYTAMMPNWNPPRNTPLEQTQKTNHTSSNTSDLQTSASTSGPLLAADGVSGAISMNSFIGASHMNANTPPSDTSSSRTMQYPFRHSPNNNDQPNDEPVLQETSNESTSLEEYDKWAFNPGDKLCPFVADQAIQNAFQDPHVDWKSGFPQS